MTGSRAERPGSSATRPGENHSQEARYGMSLISEEWIVTHNPNYGVGVTRLEVDSQSLELDAGRQQVKILNKMRPNEIRSVLRLIIRGKK
jgi:hypothetical protein